MHNSIYVLSLALVLAPGLTMAQPRLADSSVIDETTSRPEYPLPVWVEALERGASMPACDDREHWGRSSLDGGLASRRRPDSLPCRSVFGSTVRFELGVIGGGLLERSDGGIGGLSVQVGLRYHDDFSVFYQLQLLGGGWSRGGGTTIDVAGWNAVLFELTPHPVLGIAAGPSIDFTAGCDLDVDQQSSCAYAWSYGVATRVTFALGQVDSTGIVATGDFHVSLIEPSPRAVALLGIGFRL